ncbi:MAG: NAD(P)H-dependent oxidoreductase subunit E [Chloroherpetonaceae bacterium]|nr:NAD(P)H-dependent oxidoreductase subunit E [Chloroherpetonaceae bacterium]MDW8465814.1 NAD(P)H-dependent oxidoreductase subunit E [Chloroherpetonaceae bacterium]
MTNTPEHGHRNGKQQRFAPGTHGDSLEPATGIQEFHLRHAEDPTKIFFTEEDKRKIQEFIARYPAKESAVMPALWYAQEKFGWLSIEALNLVADTIPMPRADVYGVASFYTMYWKKPMGKTHLAICTNISCMLCGAYELYNYIKKTYRIGNGEVTPDGLLSLEEAECLGSCGTAPAMQVNNYEYVENLTLEKLKAFLKERGL